MFYGSSFRSACVDGKRSLPSEVGSVAVSSGTPAQAAQLQKRLILEHAVSSGTPAQAAQLQKRLILEHAS